MVNCIWEGDEMDAQKIQFAAGLQVLSFKDTYGRETEVCIGHKEIIVTHLSPDGGAESMRRYSKQELKIITDALDSML